MIQLYTIENTVQFNIINEKHVMLTAWKPDNTVLINGLLKVLLISSNIYSLENRTIASIYYNQSNIGKWNFLHNEDIDFVENNYALSRVFDNQNIFTAWTAVRSSFSLVLADENGKIIEPTPNWKFRILLKDLNTPKFLPKMANTALNTNDPETCTDFVSIALDDVNTCPIDIDTQKPMTLCLNWRRTDDIGKECRLKTDNRDLVLSIITFCNRFLHAQDCKCVNRAYRKDYQIYRDLYKTTSDFRWYPYCKSDIYLKNNQLTN